MWVIVDRLTKMARFIANTWSMEELAQAYANEIIRFHGFPKTSFLTVIRDFYPIFGLFCRRLLVRS